MANINLATGGKQNEKTALNSKKTAGVAVALFLTIGIYAGLKLYGENLSEKIAAAQNEYTAKAGELMRAGNAKNVADFQNRMTVAKNLIGKRSVTFESLSELEKLIISAVYLDSYNYDAAKGTLALGCVAGDFNDVAKQVLSFKKSDYFSEVTAKEAKMGNNGKVAFSVDLKIK